MSKKVIGALLAIVMVLSVFSFTVFAAGDTKYEVADNEYKQTWGLKTNGNKIDVVLTTNYKVGPISFKIDNVASIDSVEVGGGYYAGSTIDRSDDGVILLFPTTGAATPLAGKEMNEAVVASFTYTANSSAQTPKINGTAKGSGTTEAINGKLMATRLSGDYVDYSDFYVGQKTVKVYGLDEPWKDDDVTPPAGGDVKLQVKSGVTGVVIDENKTFGGAYAGAVYGVTAQRYKNTKPITDSVEATNGGSLVIKTTDGKTAANGNYGTGATIEVLNADGSSTGKTYVFVVFGDVDCNGLVNGNDAQAIIDAVAGNATIAPAGSYKRLAANCQVHANENIMHNLNSNDAQALIDGLATSFSQTALATAHAKFSKNYK